MILSIGKMKHELNSHMRDILLVIPIRYKNFIQLPAISGLFHKGSSPTFS